MLDRDDVQDRGDGTRVEAVAPGGEARRRLRQLIDELKGGSPLAPVTVVVPSMPAGVTLRRWLVRTGRGIGGVRFVTLDELASSLAPIDRPPLTPTVRAELARLSLDEATDGPLAAVADAASTVEAAGRTFDRLRRSVGDGEATLDALVAAGGIAADVAQAYRRFRARCTGYADPVDRLVAATANVREGATRVGPTVVHLPGALAPAESDLLRALSEVGELHVLVPATGDVIADAGTEAAWRPFRTGLRLPDVGRLRVPDLVIEAPDATEEARAATRRVLELLEDGIAADDIAVAYGAVEPYAAIVRDALTRAGVPFHGPDGTTLGRTAVGTTLLALLAWYEEDVERAGLVDWLHAVPVQVDGEPAPVKRWEQLSAEANVTRQRRHWDRRLAALARRAEDEAAAGSDRAERCLAEAQDARAMRSYVLDLIDRLGVPADLTWTGWASWALDLVDHTLGDPDGEHETLARDAVADLARLDGLADGSVRAVDRTAFVAALRRVLDRPTGSVGELGRGIHVGTVDDVHDLGHGHVIIVGAVEGALPVLPAEDPLLPDRVVSSLPSPRSLATSDERGVDARRRLAVLAAAAEDLTVTWGRADRRRQRGQVPAPWLLAAVGDRLDLGRPARVGELEPTDDGWYRRLRSAQDALDARVPLDRIERRLATVAADGGDPAEHPVLHVDPVLARGLVIERTRTSEVFGVHDANVGPHEALETLLDRAQSPTALEAYGSCPRSFLYRRVLGIDATEEPREPLTMSPRDRGSIIHEVLDRYAQRCGAAETTLQERRHLMAALADEVLAEAETRWPVGRALLWQHEQAAIRAQLDVVVSVEDRLRASFGTQVTEPEVSVGDGPDDPAPTEVDLPSGRRLRFKGRIDRLDRDAAGTSTVVASDYKTGGASSFRRVAQDPVAAGTKLQAAIYALLAEDRHPGADVHAQYWSVNGDVHPGNATVGSFSLTEQRDAILAALDLISQGIADGVFPATPGDWNDFRGTYDGCAYCPYDRICAAPGERERAWERDRRSEATAPVRALHDGAHLLPVVASDGGDA